MNDVVNPGRAVRAASVKPEAIWCTVLEHQIHEIRVIHGF